MKKFNKVNMMGFRVKLLLGILWTVVMAFTIPVLVSMKSNIAVILGFSLIGFNIWIIVEFSINKIKSLLLKNNDQKQQQ